MGLKDRLVGLVTTAKYCKVQYGPQIAFGIGVISFGACIYTSVKAGFKFREVLDEHNALMEEMKEKKEIIDQKIEAGELPADTYTEEDYKTDRRAAYVQFGMRAVRTWVLPTVFGITAIGGFGKSALLLNDRYLGAAAGLAAVTKEKLSLEEGITREYGPEALAKLKGLTESDKIINTHVDEKTGETVVDSVEIDKDKVKDKYAFSEFFDASNKHFEKNPEANRNFLYEAERYAQWKLDNAKSINGKRHLLLNDVREIFGYEPTQSGYMFGWIKYDDPAEAKKHPGSGIIDIGLNNIHDEATCRFRNGLEYVYLVKFNVEPKPIIGRCGLPK
jgi:hypothetical protein